VITGVIKANFPSRIAFKVAQRNDSRTIIDANGAESLLGNGDLLYTSTAHPKPVRYHGAYISSPEAERIANFLRKQKIQLESIDLEKIKQEIAANSGLGGGERDELFSEALRLVVTHQMGSVSLLQRRLKVGYSRAARLIDELEAAGIVGPFDGSKARQVLVDEKYLENMNKKDEDGK
jgi:S-DNA-T family DNA segregation ATPase FtsK/SpoIIIE